MITSFILNLGLTTWTAEMEKSFEKIKRLITEAPVLRHFDPHKEVHVETDTSDFAIGAVLCNGKWPGTCTKIREEGDAIF